MRVGVILAALLGFVLAAWLVDVVGFRSVESAILAVGWRGFVVLCAVGAALFVVLGGAWFVLARQGKSRFADFVWGRAIRESTGELLPFSQLGGIVIGARALTLRGVDGSLAFASSIVDVTVELVAQIVFVLAGLVFLLTVPHAPANAGLVRGIAIGVVAATIVAALFFLLQQRGSAAIARWSGRWFPKAGAWLGKLHQSLADMHASPVRLAMSLLLHIGGWVGTVLWAWLAVYLIGRRISFAFVFIIEAVVCAIRSVAIIVPGAIGVQEVSYALIGPLLGLAAPGAIALSLLKRARDVALGVPVLLIWQFAEGGRAWKSGQDSMP